MSRYQFAFSLLLAFVCNCCAQKPSTSGTFVLHKFAKPIGSETYSIHTSEHTCTLASHFLFTDRGAKVPLESTLMSACSDMTPISYVAKGQASRFSRIDDSITVAGKTISILRSGNSERLVQSEQWFIVDGYSPVAMQEQMMRWWLLHNRPPEFTIYPSKSKVQIQKASTVRIGGVAIQGYTIHGLIWGEECLWMNESQDLIALVSNDAEFDHFEAVREPYQSNLATFIAAGVRANLAALAVLTRKARMPRSRMLAIAGVTIEDSMGSPPIKDGVILIQDGMIKAVGPRSHISIPRGTATLDATGKYAIPGLWDMHAHYEQVEWGPIYLASGITTVRDVGNEFQFIRTLHEELNRKQDPAIGPHLEFAGIIDGSSPVSWGAVLANSSEQALRIVQSYKSAGARQIKIYSSVKPEVVKAIVSDAHAVGMTVTGHIPEGMSATEGVDDGMDQINHILYLVPYFSHPELGPDGKPDASKPSVIEVDGPRANDLLSSLKTHHTVIDPTVALFETFMNTVPLQQLEPGIQHLPPQLRTALDSPPAAGDHAALVEANWKAVLATLRALHLAGIPIVAGTDQAIPGYSLHRELEIYVDAGFTPLEALQAATIQSARAAGVEKESGSLEAGKRADVLLLEADPLANIRNTRTVWRVVAAGALYDPAPLWRSVDFLP